MSKKAWVSPGASYVAVCLPAKHDVCLDNLNLKMQLQTGFLDKEQSLRVIYVLELLQLPKTTMTMEFVFVSDY